MNRLLSYYKNKRVIVTGGAGFIGSHLVEALVAQEATVTVIDNLSTGKLENLSSVNHCITFIKGSIEDSELCNTVLKGASHLFHLAAQVSVPESIINPAACFATNIQGTFTLLEAARVHQIERFVFSSSCAVYGNQTEPCIETMNYAPTSPYAYSKAIGEQLCQQYAQIFALPTICLRYFNVIGERQNPFGPYAGVYAQFQDRMQKKEPVTIFGDGTQSRDFVPVAEVVLANLLAGALAPNELLGQPINVATETSRSINDLFFELKEKYQYPYNALYKPARTGDIISSQANCSRFFKLKSKKA